MDVVVCAIFSRLFEDIDVDFVVGAVVDVFTVLMSLRRLVCRFVSLHLVWVCALNLCCRDGHVRRPPIGGLLL